WKKCVFRLIISKQINFFSSILLVIGLKGSFDYTKTQKSEIKI
ncbi:hypothetical protein LCGC14_2736630, partial [marine sediment metagenome]